MGEGESSLRAPKSACSSICFIARPLEGSRSGRAGTASSGVGGMRLMRGCIDIGRCCSSGKASSTSPFRPRPVGLADKSSPCSEGESCDMERKYSERPWSTNGLSVVSGGKRLNLLPSLALSWSCLASSRLCSAKASRGDSSGGASPATWRRGDRRGPREPVEEAEPCESARRSSRLGRLDMATIS